MNKSTYDFIELVYEYPLYLSLPEKEDYFLLPALTAREMGFKTAIFASRTRLNSQKIENIKGIDVLRFDSIGTMLLQLFKSQPKLVHGHSFGWVPANVSPLFVRKSVLTPHIYKFDTYPKWKIDLAMNFIKRAKALITLTNFEASQFKNRIDESKIKVIPHAVDFDFFSSPKKFDPNRKNKFGRAVKIILCVSNIFPRKNLETLIRSFEIVKKRIPEAKLVFVGGEPKTKLGMLTASRANWHYQLQLLELASCLGVKEDVFFAGHKGGNDLLEFYQMADVFCLPSVKEGQSLASGEAAASGLPLVLSDLEPLLEIYEGCALFNKPLDYLKMAENIIEILTNPNLAETLGRRGRSKMEQYHPSIIRAKLKRLYSDLL